MDRLESGQMNLAEPVRPPKESTADPTSSVERPENVRSIGVLLGEIDGPGR